MKKILESERLILRPPKLSDASILEKYINDRLIYRWTLNIPYPYPKGGYKKWLKKSFQEMKDKKSFHFIIFLNKEPIGSVDLTKIESLHKKAVLGYWLARQYWNQGIMTEAVRMVIGFGFNQLKLNRIESTHFKQNQGSKRVQEKCGLKLEGIGREAIFKDGKLYDEVRRALLAKDYKKLKRKWNAKK